MDANSNRKCPFFEDNKDKDKDDPDLSSNKQPAAKRVRFPKGKKVKPVATNEECAKRRSQITTELIAEESSSTILNDVTAAKVNYKDNESFVDDGIQIELFNLDRERDEGYFDNDGNFVEYVNDNDFKLDSVDVEPKYAGKGVVVTNNEDDDASQLSSEDVEKMKSRIADVLEPGETVEAQITQEVKKLHSTELEDHFSRIVQKKSRAIWLWEGNKNTMFFHLVANSNHRFNTTGRLMVDRVITTNQDEIGEGLVNFYSCLSSDDDVRCPLLDDLDFSSIDEEDNIVLDKSFTKEEVLGVVKDMVGDKAPGPDGYSMAFFQRSSTKFSLGRNGRCCEIPFGKLGPGLFSYCLWWLGC
ncbi:SUPPRESSOR OF ABI3-5 [Fagus crenata]